jgi:transposase
MFRRIRHFIKGMKPYPLELRERIVASVDQQTYTIAELAEIFQVTERYIYKLLQLRRDTGDLTPLPHSGGVEPILNEARLLVIADLVAEYPDATLEEYRTLIRRRCGVTVCLATVWNALEKSAFPRKKNAPRAGSRPGRTGGFSGPTGDSPDGQTLVH